MSPQANPTDWSNDYRLYWARVDALIKEHFATHDRVDAFLKTLVNRDRAGFENELGKAIEGLRGGIAAMETTNDVSDTLRGRFRAGSFQFESSVFGEWLRFRFPDHDSKHYSPREDPEDDRSNSLYNALDHEYFERCLREAPREDCLLFSQHLEKPLCVRFTNTGKPATTTDDESLLVDGGVWKLLRRVIYSPRDTILNRSHDLSFVENVSEPLIDLLVRFDVALRHRFTAAGGRWLGEELVCVSVDAFKALSSEKQRHWARRLRLFVLSYFHTILQRAPIDKDDSIWQLCLPIGIHEKWVGSFCGAYGLPPMARIEGLKGAYETICTRLYSVEAIALTRLSSARLSVTESMVRLCTVVPEYHPGVRFPYPPELDRVRIKLHELLDADQARSPDGRFKDPVLETISTDLVSASDRFLTLLDRLFERFSSRPMSLTRQFIFLYSGPGLGKESLARLCHYFSERSRTSSKDILQVHIAKEWRRATSVVSKWLPRMRSTDALGCLNEEYKLTASWDDSRSFNYRVRNAGTLHEDRFDAELFGTAEEPGMLTGAHLLGGSAFLDEINTAPPEVANGLLRALETPYYVEPMGVNWGMELNLLVVFASNARLGELTQPGGRFNPAFGDRIHAEFTVPPLAERKEDIPLLVNRFLLRHAKTAFEEREQGLTGGKQVRFVELEGLRLLMEMPWKRNVRTIRNFVDHLLKARERRMLSDRTAETLSYEEILATASAYGYLA